MITRATGGMADDESYRRLRTSLMQNPVVRAELPKIVRDCYDLAEFWDRIKRDISNYQGRRDYLRDQFKPFLIALERQSSPGDMVVSGAIEKVTWSHVLDAWTKALDRRNSDPDGAITAARSLLETVCKHILDESGVAYDEKADLPKLYGMTAQQMNLAPSQHSDESIKRILGGCHAVVDGLAGLRNRLGDAHGKGSAHVKVSGRHAALAVNLAGPVAAFLVETWEERFASPSQRSPVTHDRIPLQ
jgi:hypothetical protein